MTFNIPHKITPTDQTSEAARAAEACGTTKAIYNRSLVLQSVKEIKQRKWGWHLEESDGKINISSQVSCEENDQCRFSGFGGACWMWRSKDRMREKRTRDIKQGHVSWERRGRHHALLISFPFKDRLASGTENCSFGPL